MDTLTKFKGPVLALYKRSKPVTDLDSFGTWFIKAWTGSPYSHSEIVIGTTWYSSSIQDGGKVRAKQIEYVPEYWDIVPLPWAGEERILDFFRKTEGQPYGWGDLILKQAFRTRIDGRGWLCSGWCSTALGLPGGDDWYPGQLHQVCRRITDICTISDVEWRPRTVTVNTALYPPLTID